MTGSAPDERSRRDAAGQIGVRPDATRAEVRAAFLRRLPREDFVPPASLATSARKMGLTSIPPHRDPPGASEESRDEEAALRAEVEDFARRFWEIPPAERKSIWNGLTKRVGGALPLRLRLEGLREGLTVAGPGLPPGTYKLVVELARTVCELYVLSPAARARAWQSRRQELRPAMPNWRDAARNLRSCHIHIANLQPEMIDELISWQPGVIAPPRPPKQVPATSGDGQKVSKIAIYVVIVVVGGLARMASHTGSDRPSYSPQPPPAFHVDPQRLDDVARWPIMQNDDAAKEDEQSAREKRLLEETLKAKRPLDVPQSRGPRPPATALPSGKSP